MRYIITFSTALLFLSSCTKDKVDPYSILEQIIEEQPDYHLFDGNCIKTNSVIFSNDNNILISAKNKDNTSVIKISKSGSLIWRKDFFIGNETDNLSIAESNTNDIFICGDTKVSDTTRNIFITKLNPQGDTLWTRFYGVKKLNYVAEIIYTSDGNLALTGYTESYSYGENQNFVLYKIDTEGEVLWTQEIDHDRRVVPLKLIEKANGNYLVSAAFGESPFYRYKFLIETDPDGNELWNKELIYGYESDRKGSSIYEWDGQLIHLGNVETNQANTTQFTNNYEGGIYISKTDASGNELWVKNHVIKFHLQSSAKTVENSFIGTGERFGCLTFFKIEEDGKIVFFKRVEQKSESDKITGMNILNDGTYSYIIGNHNTSVFMVRLDNEGNFL